MRAEMVAQHPCVDAVVVFDGDTPQRELSRIRPDVLVKGPECRGKAIPGDDVAGKVLFASDGRDCTSQIIQRVKQLHHAEIEKTETPRVAEVSAASGKVGAERLQGEPGV